MSPTDLMIVTPFGVGCRSCKKGLSFGFQSIRLHFGKNHKNEEERPSNVEIRLALDRSKDLQHLKASYWKYIHPDREASVRFCCSNCPFQSSTKRNATKHVKRTSCKGQVLERTSYLSLCGHYIPANSLPPIAHNSITPKQSSFDEEVHKVLDACEPISDECVMVGATIESGLRDYLNPKERLLTYQPSFESFALRQGSFHDNLMKLVDWRVGQVDAEGEPGLGFLIEIAELWIKEHCRYEIKTVEANLRNKIIAFEGHEYNDGKQQNVFNMRHHEQTLVREIKGMLRFMYRHDSTYLDDVKKPYLERFTMDRSALSVEGFLKYSFVQRLLVKLMLEPAPSANALSISEEYMVSRMFRKDQDGSLQMLPCGPNASNISCFLHILRCGVTSFLHHEKLRRTEDYASFSRNLMEKAQLSYVANKAGPLIRALREEQQRHPTFAKVIHEPNGDLLVRDFLFPKKKWSKFIGTVVDLARLQLQILFLENSFERVLDLSLRLEIVSLKRLEFQVNGDDVNGFLVVEPEASETAVKRLGSILELCLHGAGFGSLRLAEVDRMEIYDCEIRKSCLYYHSSSIKTYSHQGTVRREKIPHKLPEILTRIWLLYMFYWFKTGRRTSPKETSDQERNEITDREDKIDKNLLPQLKGGIGGMVTIMKEIYGIEGNLTALDIRHKWAGLLNIVFPKDTGLATTLTANDVAARQCNHGEKCHAVNYSSEVVGIKETMYRRWHEALGCSFPGLGSAEEEAPMVCVEDLRKAFKSLYGEGAEYRSGLQKALLEQQSIITDKHCFCGIACGGGKTICVTAPAVAEITCSRKITTRIFVQPYNALAQHQLFAIRNLVERFKVKVAMCCGNQIGERNFPDFLSDENNLPSILIMTIDAFSKMVRFHKEKFQRWCDAKIVSKIIIDEAHLVYTEKSFRDSFTVLRTLAQFGVPLLLLSGSLPNALVLPLLRWMNLTDDGSASDVHTIFDENLVGDFIDFNVHFIQNPVDCAVRQIREMMGEAGSVHVVCSNLEEVKRVCDGVKNYERSVASLTSADLREDKREVTAKWFRGDLRVLVSTTCALAGVESSNLRKLVLVGHVYSLLNLLQFRGRLRPSNLAKGGVELVVYLSPRRVKVEDSDQILWGSLSGDGLLKDEQRKFFDESLSGAALQNFFFSPGVCRNRALAGIFGSGTANKCGKCDICLQSPVINSRRRSTTQVDLDNKNKEKANAFLRELEETCVICSSRHCSGCFTKHRCFYCGGNHFGQNCSDKTRIRNILQKHRVCFGCYRYDCFMNCKESNFGNRLRDAIFKFFWENEDMGTSDIVNFHASIFSSEVRYYELLNVVKEKGINQRESKKNQRDSATITPSASAQKRPRSSRFHIEYSDSDSDLDRCYIIRR